MGTYIRHYGDVKINKNKKKEYIERVKKILTYGGMVQREQLEIQGKKIVTMKTPEVELNGCIYVDYNYIGDDSWETAVFDTESAIFTTEKVGWQEFNFVCMAIYVLTEFYSDNFIISECEEIRGEEFVIEWLNYLFNERYTDKRFSSMWDIYDLLYHEDALEYNYITHEVLKAVKRGYIGKLDPQDIITYAYINKDVEPLWDNICNPTKGDECDNPLLSYVLEMEKIIVKLNIKGYQYDELINILLSNREVKFKFYGNNILDGFKNYINLVPGYIILKQLCDTYGKSFWDEYDRYKDTIHKSSKLINEIFVRDDFSELPILGKVSTADFLDIPDNALCFKNSIGNNYHKSNDDLAYYWGKDVRFGFSDKFLEWTESLSEKYFNILAKESLFENIYMRDKESFIDYMVTVLNKADKMYGRIYAFKEMLCEFIDNAEKKEYQVAICLLDKLLDENWPEGKIIQKLKYDWDIADKNITFNKGRLNIKRYLAIIANPKMRKQIFEF